MMCFVLVLVFVRIHLMSRRGFFCVTFVFDAWVRVHPVCSCLRPHEIALSLRWRVLLCVRFRRYV